MTYRTLVSTMGMTRDSWLQWRRRGIGGSDIAKIAGLSKWGSPLTVWMDKTGRSEPEETGEAAYWGTVMEPILADEFAKRTRLGVRRRNAILQSDEHPFMIANIDREIVGRHEGLEIKTASEWLSDEWDGDSLPDAYYLQCQHYMAVTGYEKWWIAYLIGGNRFDYKCVHRDDDTIAKLIQIGQDFWEYVETDTMPPVDGSEATTKLLNEMYKHANDEVTVALENGAVDLIKRREDAIANIKVWENEKNLVENQLKQMMGEGVVGNVDRYTVKWKPIESTRIDSKRLKAEQPDIYAQYSNTTSYRRFDVK